MRPGFSKRAANRPGWRGTTAAPPGASTLRLCSGLPDWGISRLCQRSRARADRSRTVSAAGLGGGWRAPGDGGDPHGGIVCHHAAIGAAHDGACHRRGGAVRLGGGRRGLRLGPSLAAGSRTARAAFVLAVRSTEKLWSVLAGHLGQQTAADLAAALPAAAWHRLSAGAG